jgi:hypothetical protein
VSEDFLDNPSDLNPEEQRRDRCVLRRWTVDEDTGHEVSVASCDGVSFERGKGKAKEKTHSSLAFEGSGVVTCVG